MDLDESLPTRAGEGRTRRRRVAKLSLAAVAVALGVGAALYVHAALAPDPETMHRIQKDLDYLADAAEGHTLYTPEPWLEDPETYPGYATTLPEGGLTSSGFFEGQWLITSQFDADALTAADHNISTTPQTLCKLTGPGGADSSFKAMSGDRQKIHTVCLDVPGHPARVRVIVYRDDGEAMVDLAAALPEPGRIFDAGHYEKDPAAVDELVADPTVWAGELLDSLTPLDPSQYTAEDIYEAQKKAGRYD